MSTHPLDDDFHGKRLNLSLWRRIFAHVRPYRAHVAVLMVTGLAVAAIDSLWPAVSGMIIDEAIENGLGSRLYTTFALFIGLFAVMACCVWFFIRAAGRIATGVAFDLRQQSFDKLQDLSFSYFDARPAGWLMSRLTGDCSKIASLMPWFLLDLVWGAALIAGSITAMMLVSWRLALVVLAIVPLLIAATAYFQNRLLHSSRQVRRTNSQITASFNECIMGVRTTKSLVREEANLREFQVLSGDMYRWSVRNAMESAVYLPLITMIGSIGVGLALWRGGVSLDEGVSIGALIAFMQYAGLLAMPIQELARRFTDLQSAQAAAERVQTLLDEVPAIRDSEQVRQAMETEPASTRSSQDDAREGALDRIESIEFRNVTFAYKPGEPVLRDFSFTARAGQTVALVGATGGGKSTIISLAARFYEPTHGSILVNGVDYRERPLLWYQSRFGVVLQTPHLFSGTIRENIRYGRLDATDAEIESASRLAGAHAFVQSLENGYDSEVGEGGSGLSTGQRQLIALARAILADPQVFIMDEATSSVDTETERLIQQGVESLLHGRIAFVIAHRLSTIRNADVILVIDGGRVVEQGSHADLIHRRGRYHALYTRQYARWREEAALSGAK
jgi:ATP-binding cassette subfamily B protein